jgi:hypothetical protein
VIKDREGEIINLIDKNDPLSQREDDKFVIRHQLRLREIKEKDHSMLKKKSEVDDFYY